MGANFSKEKGTRAENLAKTILKEYTGLSWERTPLSGALDEKHGIKADIYLPAKNNIYCVEVKHYEKDHVNTSIFTSKNPQLFGWWDQTIRQSEQVRKKPLLIFKHDRSKLFVAFKDQPNNIFNYVFISINDYDFYISLLEDWLQYEQPKFVD